MDILTALKGVATLVINAQNGKVIKSLKDNVVTEEFIPNDPDQPFSASTIRLILDHSQLQAKNITESTLPESISADEVAELCGKFDNVNFVKDEIYYKRSASSTLASNSKLLKISYAPRGTKAMDDFKASAVTL